MMMSSLITVAVRTLLSSALDLCNCSNYFSRRINHNQPRFQFVCIKYRAHKSLVCGIYTVFVFVSEPLICEKLMSGKVLLCWRHDLTSEVARRRYLQSQDSLRSAHGEIANLFFSEFSQQRSDAETEETGEGMLCICTHMSLVTSSSLINVSFLTYLLSYVKT